jgi:ketosteroid isomerase-like protein
MKERLARRAQERAIFRGNCAMRCLAIAMGILLLSSGAWGQKTKKQKVDNSPMPDVPMSTYDQIDHNIGEMLGAFQVGNVEAMHKYYSDDVMFVSGSYEPPLVGWTNYVAAYQRLRAPIQAMQMIKRSITPYIFAKGDVAWATYQWQLDYLVQGKQLTARGQSTLILNKVGDNWLIVYNHTSEICPVAAQAQQTPAQNMPPPEPAKP